MAIYYIIANHDKRQYIDPCNFGDGPKLEEFWRGDTAAALLLLLTPSRRWWGGDSIELIPDCTGSQQLILQGDGDEPPYTDVSDLARDALRRLDPENNLNHASVAAPGPYVWLLTTGNQGDDGDPWKVISCHASEQSANEAKEAYERPIPRTWSKDGTAYRLEANVECWDVFP